MPTHYGPSSTTRSTHRRAPMRACDYPATVTVLDAIGLPVSFTFQPVPGPTPAASIVIAHDTDPPIYLQLLARDSVFLGQFFRDTAKTARYPDGDRTIGESFDKLISKTRRQQHNEEDYEP
jgi:hypothetical protein